MSDATKPRLVGINHVALEVDDIDRALDFYGHCSTSSSEAARRAPPSSTSATSSSRSCKAGRSRATEHATSASNGYEKGLICRLFMMGRAGFEPATSGLKVRLDELKRTASNRNGLQDTPIGIATNCSKTHLTETNLYAHRTHTALAVWTTCVCILGAT